MAVVTVGQRGSAFTRDDLDALPDDGRRHELVDGLLIVTPAPSWRHQDAVLELAVRLRATCPPRLRVFVAPLGVVLSGATVLEPDVLVARMSDLGTRDLPAAPVLAVEVLSASTRRLDLTLKRATYEAAGCPSYWVIDPDVPSLRAWELRDGGYVEVAHVVGQQAWTCASPFPVQVRPSDLVRPPAE